MATCDLSIRIGKLKLKNPLMLAAGTSGWAEEFADFIDLKKLGAIVTKTITLRPREGNPPPRTCETPAGMLNSVGLANPGLETFIREKLPVLAKFGIPLIVSIASEQGAREFVELAKRLDKIREVAAIELNISCPNIKNSRLISQRPNSTYSLVRQVRRATKKTLIVKLTPNVTSIAEIAAAAEKAGAQAVSLINTLSAMAIDIENKKPKLASVTGGLSGPAIRPVAVGLVWQVFRRVNLPIIGMGGIMDYKDALEFIIAGASGICLGTANFVNPAAAIEVIEGIKKYMLRKKINSINFLIGSLQV